MPDPAALMLPGDAFDVDHQQIIGRRVAGRSMALGFASQLTAGETLSLICFNQQERSRLQDLLTPNLHSGASLRFLDFNTKSLTDIGAIHVPDPGLSRWQLLRSSCPANAFSLTGIIHTLSSSDVISELERLFLSPLHPWDALVCTSTAGRDVVRAVFQSFQYYLESHFSCSITKRDGLQLPIIPLAVSDPLSESLGFVSDRSHLRCQSRMKLQIDQSSFVILFVGRLSFHSKSHPLPLYRAVNRLSAENPDRPIVLLECGHIFNQPIESAYQELEHQFSHLSIVRLGGLEPATEQEKRDAFAAADVFVSLADNLQETFGLSIIEAMAASLPVISTDWNGYKDLVDNGISGFRIPVSMVSDNGDQYDRIDSMYGLGLLPYDTMIGLRSMATIVEYQPLYRALNLCLNSSSLVQLMGENARKRWMQSFSWGPVYRQYIDLWTELADRRLCLSEAYTSVSSFPTPTSKPFSHYPTQTIKPHSVVCGALAEDELLPLSTLRLAMNSSFLQSLADQHLESVITHLEHHHCIDFMALTSLGISRSNAFALLAALIKLGVAILDKGQ